jgi:1-acyl-sn-glycerol-3-phosphate acyltransferase/acyl carrier protein
MTTRAELVRPETLLDVFNQFADLPGACAIYDNGYRYSGYSYREIAAGARRFATRLEEHSIRKGDKLILWGENRPEWLAVFWGCILRGVIVIPVDYRATPEFLSNILRMVTVSVVLAGEGADSSALVIRPSVWSLSSVEISGPGGDRKVTEICPSDIVEIIFRSVSAAPLEGVSITHRSIIADLAPIERELKRHTTYARLRRPVRLLSLLPLSSMFGQVLAAFVPPLLGGTVVFIKSCAPHEIIRQIRRRHISFLVAVPRILFLLRQYLLAMSPDLAQLPHERQHWVIRQRRYHQFHRLFGGKFRSFVVGSAPLGSELKEFWSRAGFQVIYGYGLTEALPRTDSTGKLVHTTIRTRAEQEVPTPAIETAHGVEELIQKHVRGVNITLDAALDQFGLSSIDRVELMIELEQRFNITIDESAFNQAGSMANLVDCVLHSPPYHEPLVFADWPRCAFARLIRRMTLAGIILPLTRICARSRVTGVQWLRTLKGPVIFASNHQSYLDTPVIMGALTRQRRYLLAVPMWKEFFDAHFHPNRHLLLEWFANSINYYLATLLFNAFPLPQQERGIRETVRHIGDLISEGWSILIFPEGERTMTGEIGNFKAGVGMMGSKLQVPIIPIRLRGIDHVLRRGSWTIHPGTVEVAFGAPLKVVGDDYAALAERVEAAVRAL